MIEQRFVDEYPLAKIEKMRTVYLGMFCSLLDEIKPTSFVINAVDCTIDGIKVRFPKCIIYFREGFESNMSMYLSDTLSNKYWSSFDLVHYVYAPYFEKEIFLRSLK